MKSILHIVSPIQASKVGFRTTITAQFRISTENAAPITKTIKFARAKFAINTTIYSGTRLKGNTKEWMWDKFYRGSMKNVINWLFMLLPAFQPWPGRRGKVCESRGCGGVGRCDVWLYSGIISEHRLFFWLIYFKPPTYFKLMVTVTNFLNSFILSCVNSVYDSSPFWYLACKLSFIQ